MSSQEIGSPQGKAIGARNANRVAYGCLAVIALPLVAILGYIWVSDHQVRAKIRADHEARELLDSHYAEQLSLLDTLFEKLFERCTSDEKKKITLARDYFHTGEAASHSGPDEYRRGKFAELQTGIAKLKECIEALGANPGVSPFEVAKKIKDFNLF